MFASVIKCIIILIVILYSVSSHSDIEQTNKRDNAEKYYNHILNILIGLNDKRVGNLKRLYTLNNYNFGKKSLRNLIENAKGYDDLINNINVVINEINDNTYDDPYHALNLYRTSNLNIRNGNNFEENTSDDISDKNKYEEDNISDKMSIADGNIINALRYYYFICSNSRKKCKKACRKSYKHLCSRYDCTNNFESNMEDSCKKACRKRF